jgi:D-glycero-alpha-D-manno-heptose-7-phosphate kinase
MRENTALQAELAPGIVSPTAEAAIEVARAAGALGWKVNGAGGEGGSITLLADGDPSRLAEAVTRLGPPVRLVPVALSPTGLRVS